MFGTYKREDVTILLKDISGLVPPTETKEKEECLRKGMHYSEMLPKEYVPTPKYMHVFESGLEKFAPETARVTAITAGKIMQEIKKRGEEIPVLVSLARAGTPIGILLRHYLGEFYHVDAPHYTISIIRGKGIDENALQYILQRYSADQVIFVDGWTGKGAIRRELGESLDEFCKKTGIAVPASLAVLSDPAGVAEISGTKEDIFLANACLNATVSGLLSRTFHRPDIIKNDDFHGAAFYKDLLQDDVTYCFINTVEKNFYPMDTWEDETLHFSDNGLQETKMICDYFGIKSIHHCKPSIGETTRVLLRRDPWKILVHSLSDEENLGHIYQLAAEKNIPVEEYPLRHYKACGIIKE